MEQDDLIMAFFPCTYFEVQSQMFFYGSHFSLIDKSIEEKCKVAMERHEKLNEFYVLLNQLVIVCVRKKLRMVIENPYSQPHYLTTYWCINPTIIDKDRTKNGDYYKKPTQYWFINLEPKNNFVFESIEYVEKKTISGKVVKGIGQTTARTMIHPQYASRFIKQYLIDYETDAKQFFGFNPYQE